MTREQYTALPFLERRLPYNGTKSDFKRGFAGFGVNIDGNAPAVVNNGNGVVRMNGNINMSAESRHCFIDGVIDDFINKVVQAS